MLPHLFLKWAENFLLDSRKFACCFNLALSSSFKIQQDKRTHQNSHQPVQHRPASAPTQRKVFRAFRTVFSNFAAMEFLRKCLGSLRWMFSFPREHHSLGKTQHFYCSFSPFLNPQTSYSMCRYEDSACSKCEQSLQS